MKQYLGQDDIGDVTVTQNLNPDQFGEIEVLGAFVQMNDIRANWWEGIGFGGSISGRATVKDERIWFGACDKILYCLDMDGKELWRFKTNGVILEGPAVSDDMIFQTSTDHNVYCIDKKTGTEIWRFQAKDKIVEMPYYHNGRLYVGGCLDNTLYCLDAKSGELIWKFYDINGVGALPVIHEDRLYFGYAGNKFYCLDLDGNVVWTFPTKDIIAAWPAVIYKDKIYFGSWDCNCYCIDLDGNLVWKFGAPDPVMSPVVWNDKVCFSCWDNNVYCLDSENGSLRWKMNANGFPGGLTAVYDGYIFVGSTDNNVYAIDIESGEKVWKYNINGFSAQIISVDNRVYAGSWDCNLYCLDAKSGELIWKFPTSIATPSKINPTPYSPKTAEVIWRQESEDGKKKKKDDEFDIADYGDFSGAYIDTTKTDYLGLKKKGYVK